MQSVKTITLSNGDEIVLTNYAIQMESGFIANVWATSRVEAAKIIKGTLPSWN